MTSERRMMRLGAFVHETGQHVAAWRHPDAYAESGTVFAQALDVARIAERENSPCCSWPTARQSVSLAAGNRASAWARP